MTITKGKYIHDLLNPILYIILATIFGLKFCAGLTEGYVEMITIAFYSMTAGILSIVFIIIMKQFPEKYISYENLFGLIPLLLFEFILILIGETSLFGLVSNEPINFGNSKFVVSLTSLASIVMIYGISIWTKALKNNKN
jgi:hypothetical protein